MSELDDIKARAAERRNRLETKSRNSGERLHATLDCDQAETDLDRVIALLEEAQRACHVYQFDNGRSICVKCGEEQRSVIDF